MKIAVPSAEKVLSADINTSFGRTAYFLVIDSNDLDFEVIENKASGAQGGAGIIASQAIVDSGAEAIIAYQCGKNAADVLLAAGIRMFKAEPGSIEDNVRKLEQGDLKELAEIHAGFHRHGGGK